MRKKTKALSGASQDAYFRRVLKANPNLSADERDQLVRRLRQEVAQLRVRMEPRRDGEAASGPAPAAEPSFEAAPDPPGAIPVELVAPLSETPAISAEPPASSPEPAFAAEPFDPFSPNIVVVVRKSGRAAALAALDAIDSLDNLRLLAREQRLSVGADLATTAEVRAAIVTAAERRIANRMAAAS
jgi:hypothetical protein